MNLYVTINFQEIHFIDQEESLRIILCTDGNSDYHAFC